MGKEGWQTCSATILVAPGKGAGGMRALQEELDDGGEEEQTDAEEADDLAGDGSVPDRDGEAVVRDEGVADQDEGHSQEPETG